MELFDFWGKAEKGGTSHHPAVCHMIDTGLVADALLQSTSPAFREFFLRHLDCSEETEAIRWIAFFSSLHDIGKLSPGFQAKRPDLTVCLPREDFPFSTDLDETDHGRVTFMFLKEFLIKTACGTYEVATGLACAVAGHHGEFHQIPSPQQRASIGKGKWQNARIEAVEVIRESFGLEWKRHPFRSDDIPAPFLLLLAGLTSVADWIASSEEFFGYITDKPQNLVSYVDTRRRMASVAVKVINLDHHPAKPGLSNFATLFPFKPNACQTDVLEVSGKLEEPFLLIVETPMGSGKTEAALAVADRLLRESGASGLYYALPTQATGNKMFNRVKEFLGNNEAYCGAELHLLHGYSDLHEGYSALRLASVSGKEKDASVIASSWFCSKKRGLISPFAVGTIDQALMSILQARHMFVRLYGLAGKVVVIDEVHAYDTYTSTLLDRLLEWLSAINTPVILLSATLPGKRRAELIRAYSFNHDPLPEVRYPSVIAVTKDGRCFAKEVEGLPTQSFRTELIRAKGTAQWDSIAELLSLTLKGGGCAACIVNTVREAQELFRHLKTELKFKNETSFILFHARFPLGQRLEIENEIDRLFGKGDDTDKPNENRPFRAVVVATQVLEQSLDVDFDIMVSGLAPVDLLLQRVGRLHRHKKNNKNRPDTLKEAVFYCVQTDLSVKFPDFGLTGKVYEPFYLLKTALVLEKMADSDIVIPDTVAGLISQVYGPREVECPDHLAETLEDWRFGNGIINREIQFRGHSAVIPAPSIDGNDSEILLRLAQTFDDDDLLPMVQAQTRLTRPSIMIIILHQVGKNIFLDRNLLMPVSLEKEPDSSLTRLLLQRSVQVSNPVWYGYFNAQEVPAGWNKSPMLSHCRSAVFTDGALKNGSDILRIDDALGLVMTAKKKEGMDDAVF